MPQATGSASSGEIVIGKEHERWALSREDWLTYSMGS